MRTRPNNNLLSAIAEEDGWSRGTGSSHPLSPVSGSSLTDSQRLSGMGSGTNMVSEFDEVMMEAMVLSEVAAIKHAVVVHAGRDFLACILTLMCEADGSTLAPVAKKWAQAQGSLAETAQGAKNDAKFRDGLLAAFGRCNKMVQESARRQGIQRPPTILRRFALVTDQFTLEGGLLLPTGKPNRQAVAFRFSDVISRMCEGG
eukprot:CAMPEP_0174933714 /NCGR_PEP_ID=MMETSP1355-20121228/46669_1 /TAXON_ID=464990 /ORGANISM="Hemiselmis tepida, Strain CCMP443" /LENGTH=201 /DNA_ID=CAMNT_0016180245 /DNA_START=336 /DNA_END=938 /DNA_ORIENTATION=+